MAKPDNSGKASKQLMIEAERIVTPKLLIQIKGEIAHLGHDTDPPHKWEQLIPHVKGCLLGELDGHKVFAVDSDKVMLFYYMDFVIAGNDLRYPDFIPKGQFWVDHVFVDKTTSDYRHDLLHECLETRMLKAWGADSYDDRAHPAANEFERRYMIELGLDKEEPCPICGKVECTCEQHRKATLKALPWSAAIPKKAPVKP
jgi:hypothetical protein